MKAFLAAALLAVTAACGPRQVEVQTAPPQQSEVAVHVTNNLSTPVNVYVTSGGSDMFLKQVNGNSSEHLPVRGVASGSTVTLKASTIDNSRTYTKENVVLSGMYMWQVP